MKQKFSMISIIAFVLVISIAFPVFGGETEEDTLTLNQAIKKAFLNSTTLRNGQLEIDKKEIQRDDLKQTMIYTPIDYVFQPTDVNIFKGFYSTDYELRKNEKKLVADKRQLIIDVTALYHKVLKSEEALGIQKINLAKEMIKISQTRSKYSVGLATKADILSAEALFASQNASLKEAETNLANAYAELNKIIGQDINKRPMLLDKIKFSPEQLDTDTEVLKAVNNSYEMWSAEEAAKLANVMKLFETRSNIGNKNEDQAQNAVLDAKEEIKVQTKSLCSTIQTLEAKYLQLDQQVKQLEENLRVIKIQYELGLTTRDNVLAIEGLLKQTKAGKNEVASQHEISIKTLKKLTGELSIKRQ